MKTEQSGPMKYGSMVWFGLWLALSTSAVLWTGPAVANDDWAAGAGPDWEEAMSAARAEDAVVVAGPAQIAEKIAATYEEDTGLKIDFLGGSNRDIRTRFRKEVAAGVMTIDVKIGGSGEIVLAKKGLLEPVAPLLMLPSVSGPANWINDRIKWVDIAQTYMPIPNEYVFGWLVVNKDMVPEGAIKTWQDLLKPEFKGKIIAFDPTIAGPGQAAASYLGELFGEDYLRRLYVEQNVTLVRKGRQVVESVALGNHAIALGAVSPNVERFRTAGIDSLYVPEMSDGPGSILGGSSVPVIARKAPHPNAAAVFLNWYLSPRGQQILQDVWQTPSRRRDIAMDGLPEYVIPRSDRIYLDQYQEAWYITMRKRWSDYLGDILGN